MNLTPPPLADSTLTFLEEAAAVRSQTRYVLRLFVTAHTPLSNRAIVNTRRICEQHLAGRYDLEIVDIVKNPLLAASDQVIASPTLIKKGPLPPRRFIGDMSQTERILTGLGLRKTVETQTPQP
ncbi:circadian clock KaiB family protein [Prosthecobacter sp.]|uniref:circadian clock KaiB family protein n=1 Tax=Prosthecobacter sp. TaxID=1965333 RepID=UPI003783B9CE